MRSSLSLSKKLYGGFALILGLLVVLGVVLGKNLSQVRTQSGKYSNNADSSKFMVEKEVDHLTWMAKLNDLFLENQDKAHIQVDPTKCGLGKFLNSDECKTMCQHDTHLAQLVDAIREPHKHLHESAVAINHTWKQRHEGLGDLLRNLLVDHQQWVAQVSKMVILKDPSISVQTDCTLCRLGKFLTSQQYEQYGKDFPLLHQEMQTLIKPHKDLHASATNIAIALRSNAADKAAAIYQDQTLPALAAVETHLNAAIKAETALLTAESQAKDVYQQKTVPALQETQARLLALRHHLEDMANKEEQALQTTAVRAQWISGIVPTCSVLLGILVSVLLVRSITRPVNRVIEGLRLGATQTSTASQQVAQASQQMAEGASEQASSLEEVSSSLEEMSSMTKQNADNAAQANRMAGEARDAAEHGNTAMTRMADAINQIKSSSDQTAKIVKTIDEIAFQTNLLALNAAVEAARAGEAGKGFAVVAEEVRNLAQRSAEAAKNTSALIEESQKNAENGVAVSTEVAQILGQIVTGVQKVNGLIGEVSTASNEQNQGIEQINTAIAQMDTVTQSNAANAEESASASEELSAQAKELNDMVNTLVTIVDGSRGGKRATHPAEADTRHEDRRAGSTAGIQHQPATGQFDHLLHKTWQERDRNRHEPTAAPTGNRKGTPQEVIPLDADELSTF